MGIPFSIETGFILLPETAECHNSTESRDAYLPTVRVSSEIQVVSRFRSLGEMVRRVGKSISSGEVMGRCLRKKGRSCERWF
jgi:hypothetical protein